MKPEYLDQLKSYRLPGLEIGEDLVHPNYRGFSLANVPASICHWLGAPHFGAQMLDENLLSLVEGQYQHVVFFLVDGLGYEWFHRFLQSDYASLGGGTVWEDDILPRCALETALTSVVPSTTTAALTTLWTGAFPSEHGILGYEMWLKEYGILANMILHNPASYYGDVGSLQRAGFNPEAFLPSPTLGPHLVKAGVQPFGFLHAAISGSGLSRMQLPGINHAPFRTLTDLCVSIADMLKAKRDERTYSYAYWSVMDELGHHFGPGDERVSLEFNSFSMQLAHFLRKLQDQKMGNVLFLLAADHGMLDTPVNDEYALKNHPELESCLTMVPSGENRLPYVFLRPGKLDQAREYIENTWKGKFIIVPSETALASGLFGLGDPYNRVLERLGDWVVIPQGDAYWWWAEKKNPLRGRHGGLSSIEMLVPFLAMKM
jgi:hypothetical protein